MNVTTLFKSQAESPPAKKHKAGPDSSLLSMISNGNAADMFTKDVTRAFSSVNVPLAQRGTSPMKKEWERYVVMPAPTPLRIQTQPGWHGGMKIVLSFQPWRPFFIRRPRSAAHVFSV